MDQGLSLCKVSTFNQSGGWDPIDCGPLSLSVPGILQARILEGVAIPFSSGGDLPDPVIEPSFPTLQADSLPTEL